MAIVVLLINKLDPIPSRPSETRQSGSRILGKRKKCPVRESNVNEFDPIPSWLNEVRQKDLRILGVKIEFLGAS